MQEAVHYSQLQIRVRPKVTDHFLFSHFRFINSQSSQSSLYSHGVSVVFDDSVVVTRWPTSTTMCRSNLVVDGKTLLTRLGSLVGVGRTLLWILLALLGVFNSIQICISFCASKDHVVTKH